MTWTEKQLETAGMFLHVYNGVIRPQLDQLLTDLEDNSVTLEQAITSSVLISCTIDYLMPFVDSAGSNKQVLYEILDDRWGIRGSGKLPSKMELLIGVGMAIRHAGIEEGRNKNIVKRFGLIDPRYLRQEDGVVWFKTDRFRFDYPRVVLRPIVEAIGKQHLESLEDALDFLASELEMPVDECDLDDWVDPIDSMIEHCHPECVDCGLDCDDCRCETFDFDGVAGETVPDSDPDFDFHHTMSRISGSYRKD